MATQKLHRLVIITPAARRAAINTFFATQLDEGGDAFTVGLNASGSQDDAITHYWNNRSYTPQELKKLMQRLCNLANILPPADWDTITRQQRKQWLLNQRQTIRNATGIWIMVADNDKQWDDPNGGLLAMVLKTTADREGPATADKLTAIAEK